MTIGIKSGRIRGGFICHYLDISCLFVFFLKNVFIYPKTVLLRLLINVMV